MRIVAEIVGFEVAKGWMPRLAASAAHNSIGPPLQQYAKTQPAAHRAAQLSLWTRDWDGGWVCWSSRTAAATHRHSVECASDDCGQTWRHSREGPSRHRRPLFRGGIIDHSQCTMTHQLFLHPSLVLLLQAGAAPPSPLSDALSFTMRPEVSFQWDCSGLWFWRGGGLGNTAVWFNAHAFCLPVLAV